MFSPCNYLPHFLSSRPPKCPLGHQTTPRFLLVSRVIQDFLKSKRALGCVPKTPCQACHSLVPTTDRKQSGGDTTRTPWCRRKAETPSWVQDDELCVTGRKSWEILAFTVPQRHRKIWGLCFNHKHVLVSSGKGTETAFDFNCGETLCCM